MLCNKLTLMLNAHQPWAINTSQIQNHFLSYLWRRMSKKTPNNGGRFAHFLLNRCKILFLICIKWKRLRENICARNQTKFDNKNLEITYAKPSYS